MISESKPPALWKLIILVALLWLLGFTVIWQAFDDMEKRGQFGDLFGAINSLFSALAFAGVLYTVLMQRQELAMQREELEASRESQRLQNEMMSAQLRKMEESLEFEREKRKADNEPIFDWRSVSHSGRHERHTYNFKNTDGGRFRITAVKVSKPEVGVEVGVAWTQTIIASNGEGVITFGPSTPGLEFTVTCLGNGFEYRKAFRITDPNQTPKPIES